MGTAHVEIPVAKFTATSFEVSLTQKEVLILQEALELLRSHSERSILYNPHHFSSVSLETLIKEFKEVAGS